MTRIIVTQRLQLRSLIPLQNYKVVHQAIKEGMWDKRFIPNYEAKVTRYRLRVLYSLKSSIMEAAINLDISFHINGVSFLFPVKKTKTVSSPTAPTFV